MNQCEIDQEHEALAIKSIPSQDKEKYEDKPFNNNSLTNIKPESLSDADLLALFVSSKDKDEAEVQGTDIGRRLVRKYGGIAELGRLEVRELATEYGMSHQSAARVLGAFELAARCATEKMTRKSMNSAEAIYQGVGPRLAHQKNENVLVIMLDVKLQAVRTHVLSQGNCNTALCEPRDVLREVVISSAPAFVLVHNHPSGDPSPSRQDLALTKKIQQASEFMNLRFVDHLIIGRPGPNHPSGFYSFTASGVI
jgi:DNA repair protein RadC